MASRRFPDGFLARPAKAASAGALLLALAAAAALCVAGCGGGDSSTTANGDTADSPGSPDSPATKEAPATRPPSKQGAPSKEAKEGEARAPQGAPGAKGAKHAPGVARPSGEREPGITPKQRSQATTADIRLQSAAFTAGNPLPTAFTCEGADLSPPLRWSGVPSSANELVLMALNLLPVEGALFFDWAVAGLDPDLSELEKGKLPEGAVLGENSFGKRGYSICPPESGKAEKYLFMIYAIPTALDPKPGFDPLRLREEVLAEAGNVGLLATSYER